MDNRHQPGVEAHVAVVDMAELMGDHRLQFLTVEHHDGAAGDPDHRFLWGKAGGECIDPGIGQHVHLRYRRARGQGHFLDHIEQPLFFQAVRVQVDQPATQALGDHLAAGFQFGVLAHAAADHHQEHYRGDHRGQLPVEARRLLHLLEKLQPEQVQRQAGDRHQAQHGQDHQQHQGAGTPFGPGLVFKKFIGPSMVTGA